MKRRITPKQLQELTNKQKRKLRKWWKPAEGDYIAINCIHEQLLYDDGEYILFNAKTKKIYGLGCINGDMYPLLNIGQMIELLKDKAPTINIYFSGTLDNEITVPLEQLPGLVKKIVQNPDICDALWEAVKQTL